MSIRAPRRSRLVPREPGGAMPYSRSFRRAPARSSRSSTPATARFRCAHAGDAGAASASRMPRHDELGRRAAGIRRRDAHDQRAPDRRASHSIARTMPSSTTDTTGISGSGTVSSACQSAASGGAGARCCAAWRCRRSRAARASPSRAHHCASGYARCRNCISASRWPRCSVCTPCLPPVCCALHPAAAARPASPRRAPRRRAAATAPRAARTSAAMPASASVTLDRVGDEHLAGVHPQRVDGRLHLRVRLVGAVAEPDHPVAGALDVVGDFLRALGGDFGDARDRRERVSASSASRCHASNRNCRAIVSAKLPFGCSTSSRLRNSRAVAQERELVLAAAMSARSAPRPRRRSESHSRAWPRRSSPTLVSAMSSSSDRALADPLAETLREDERRVAEAQQVLEQAGSRSWWQRRRQSDVRTMTARENGRLSRR